MLISNFTLLGTPDLDRVGFIELVIARLPCQDHTQVGYGLGLQDPKSRMF